MVKEFNKSFSNTSTTSIESGIFDVDFIPDEEVKEIKEKEEEIGEIVKKVLSDAKEELRLICGWESAIKYLNETENPEHSLFFFLVPSKGSDSIAHIREVMLKAFCLDNDIYVIQLDSAEKLNEILGCKNYAYQCALVQRSSTLKCLHPDDGIDLDDFTQLEDSLIDYCEEFWYEPIQPIIRLPDK